jgi:hypothetical protein
MEKGADLITASIAARARRQYPNNLAARVAWFNAEATRLEKRFWDPAATVRRSGAKAGAG